LIGSVLVANRGEIARRIFRTARRLGMATIAVHSDADADAAFVREADAALRIGPAPPRESYLDIEAVLEAARASGAEAIHPGYGFLSENPDFAERVIGAGLVWIGPPPAAIRAMGLKDEAKRLMAKAGVPVTPGYLGEDPSPERLAQEAERLGWPVLIKAVAGGGGRGMRRVDRAADFTQALEAARREALGAFDDDRVLLERYARRPRHIEVQVFGDQHGNIVHLFERDCSSQRRHQKLVEEAPAPGMAPEVREAVCAAAIRAARAVGYQSAGTVEFIADCSQGLSAERIWFMEMNTRLQVEHPVTELVTGLDLVEWQFRVASGEPLPLGQEAIRLSGHAIEARLCAEDPAKGFAPSAGELRRFLLPDTLRVDSGFEEGGRIPTEYDSLIAKLVSHAPDRAAAIERLGAACEAVEVWPVRTNAGFLARLLKDPDFATGEVRTSLIDEHFETLAPAPEPSSASLCAAGAALAGEADGTPWTAAALRGFRLGGTSASVLVETGGRQFAVSLQPPPSVPALRDGEQAIVFEGGEAYAVSRPRAEAGAGAEAGDGRIVAPMPGRIAAVGVTIGDEVGRGQTLVTLEAMKMEHALIAPFAGVVRELRCAVGDQVIEGALLISLGAAPAP
jgi:3-methylcrotonyl-CoA carboxylase alpha subunit